MNLTSLNDRIAKQVPIVGIGRNPDGTLRIDFSQKATQEEKKLAQEILETWTDFSDPQWKFFGKKLAIAPEYLRITTYSNLTLGVKSTLELMLKISADGDLRLESIRDLWNAIAAESNPTTEEIAAINQIIKDSAIDQFFYLQNNGTMVLG